MDCAFEYLVKATALPVPSSIYRLFAQPTKATMGNLPTPEPEPNSPVLNSSNTSTTTTSSASSQTSILHIVHFRYYAHIPPSKRAQISKQFTHLQHTCIHPQTHKPYIRSFTGGTDVSIENLQRGYHVAFLLEFACREDRDYYVKEDAAHRSFGVEMLTGVVEEVMVVDFRRGEF
jgi:hypothetical protein